MEILLYSRCNLFINFNNLAMAKRIESNKKIAELKREFILLKNEIDGQDLDKLTIEQLQKAVTLHQGLNAYIMNPTLFP
jgi:hypothetical protein